MNIEPLTKNIYNKAVAMGLTKIVLSFSGGSDQGYLDVTLYPWEQGRGSEFSALEAEIENWAWDAYCYSGAGDGSEYGDEIIYDLVTKKVATREWCMVRQDKRSDERDLKIESDDE